MSNVIDFNARLIEKEKEEKRKTREMNKRRKFELSVPEANILINSYINYINAELEEYQNLDSEEDKMIGKNEIKTMFSLLRMLYKKYKNMDYQRDNGLCVLWNYKNLYYTIMAAYDSVVDSDADYEYLETEEKLELNLYYRLVDLEHNVSECVHGSSISLSEIPVWLREEELLAQEDYEVFKENYYQEFLNKVILVEETGENEGKRFYLKQSPEGFNKVMHHLIGESKVDNCKNAFPKGYRINLGWDELNEYLFGFNVELVTISERETEQLSHIYSVELLEVQIVDLIMHMRNIGINVSDSLIK